MILYATYVAAGQVIITLSTARCVFACICMYVCRCVNVWQRSPLCWISIPCMCQCLKRFNVLLGIRELGGADKTTYTTHFCWLTTHCRLWSVHATIFFPFLFSLLRKVSICGLLEECSEFFDFGISFLGPVVPLQWIEERHYHFLGSHPARLKEHSDITGNIPGFHKTQRVRWKDWYQSHLANLAPLTSYLCLCLKMSLVLLGIVCYKNKCMQYIHIQNSTKKLFSESQVTSWCTVM